MESLIQRSIPLGTIMGVATWTAVQQGYLSKSSRFGAGPKIFAVFLFNVNEMLY